MVQTKPVFAQTVTYSIMVTSVHCRTNVTRTYGHRYFGLVHVAMCFIWVYYTTALYTEANYTSVPLHQCIECFAHSVTSVHARVLPWCTLCVANKHKHTHAYVKVKPRLRAKANWPSFIMFTTTIKQNLMEEDFIKLGLASWVENLK